MHYAITIVLFIMYNLTQYEIVILPTYWLIKHISSRMKSAKCPTVNVKELYKVKIRNKVFIPYIPFHLKCLEKVSIWLITKFVFNIVL